MKKTLSLLVLLAVLLSFSLAASSCTETYACQTCKDKTRITCGVCDGEKEKTCTVCNGKGKTDCSMCYGTGMRICYSCAGTGSKYEYDFFTKMYKYKSCYACVGGRVACVQSYMCSCLDGQMTCTLCDQDGMVDCPDCTVEKP